MNLRILVIAVVLAAVSIIAAILLLYHPAPAQPLCDSFDYVRCPSRCVICPPCEVCSSVACRSVEFCASLGFDKGWWQRVGHPAG